MSDAKVGRWATGITIGSVALLVVTSIGVYLSARRLTAPVYAIGERVDLPRSLYDGASRTLVVIAQSSCSACQAAKPLLGQLVAETRRVSEARVAVVVERAGAEELAFAAEIGVSSGELVPLDLKRFKVRRVPTVLVVDAGGAIRFSHENAPDVGEQATLLVKYREALKRP